MPRGKLGGLAEFERSLILQKANEGPRQAAADGASTTTRHRAEPQRRAYHDCRLKLGSKPGFCSSPRRAGGCRSRAAFGDPGDDT